MQINVEQFSIKLAYGSRHLRKNIQLYLDLSSILRGLY